MCHIGPAFSLGRSPIPHSRTSVCSHTLISITLIHMIWSMDLAVALDQCMYLFVFLHLLCDTCCLWQWPWNGMRLCVFRLWEIQSDTSGSWPLLLGTLWSTWRQCSVSRARWQRWWYQVSSFRLLQYHCEGIEWVEFCSSVKHSLRHRQYPWWKWTNQFTRKAHFKRCLYVLLWRPWFHGADISVRRWHKMAQCSSMTDGCGHLYARMLTNTTYWGCLISHFLRIPVTPVMQVIGEARKYVISIMFFCVLHITWLVVHVDMPEVGLYWQ